MVASPGMEKENIIGFPAPRKEGRDKVTGKARYIDDITLPNMLYGATVRSQHRPRQNQENYFWSGNTLG